MRYCTWVNTDVYGDISYQHLQPYPTYLDIDVKAYNQLNFIVSCTFTAHLFSMIIIFPVNSDEQNQCSIIIALILITT